MRQIQFLILLFISSLLQAQTSFLVYQVSGTATCKENNKDVQLKIGKILPATTTIVTGKNSNVTLICDNITRTITLKPGVHELKKYADACKTPGNSLAVNYLKYVWWQLTGLPSSATDEGNKIAGTGGGVSRGCGGIESEILFDTICFYKENITLRWKTTGSFTKKEFVVYENVNSVSPFLTIRLNKDEFAIGSIKDKLQESTEYYWKIRLDDKETCSGKVLQIWGEEDFKKLRDEIKNSMDVSLDKAEQNYMFGYFMEVNHFYGEAYKYYKAAAVAQPANTRYKNTVERFRLTWKIK